MPKQAKKKAQAATPTQQGKRPSRARHHGRTFCRYCFKKIAFGNAFCNKEHRAKHTT